MSKFITWAFVALVVGLWADFFFTAWFGSPVSRQEWIHALEMTSESMR